jgi:hypothetical protein
MPIRSDEQIVRLRRFVREKAVAQGLSLIDQTKFVTAASELARNTLIYGLIFTHKWSHSFCLKMRYISVTSCRARKPRHITVGPGGRSCLRAR